MRHDDQRRHNQRIVEVAEDGNEIRDEVDRGQQVTDGQTETPARQPRGSGMSHDSPVHAEFMVGCEAGLSESLYEALHTAGPTDVFLRTPANFLSASVS